MTPIDRIRQKRQMVELSIEMEKPVMLVQSFPRNSTALAILLFAVSPLMYKSILDPSLSNIVGYGLSTLGFGIGLFALTLGQKKQSIYDGSVVAHAPTVPFKSIGSATFALSAAGLTLFQGGSVAQAVAVLPVTGLLCSIAFGLDPRGAKGLCTVDERQTHKLEGLAARVGAQMERIQKVASRVPVPAVVSAIRSFDQAVDRLLGAVTDDPDRANTVRKYFTVYLDGIAEATERFAGVYVNTGSPEAKFEYLAMLEKLTDAYTEKTLQYSEAGRISLDVQMEVLDDYLARERLAG